MLHEEEEKVQGGKEFVVSTKLARDLTLDLSRLIPFLVRGTLFKSHTRTREEMKTIFEQKRPRFSTTRYDLL